MSGRGVILRWDVREINEWAGEGLAAAMVWDCGEGRGGITIILILTVVNGRWW